jgi:hypothetical protein
MDPAVYDLIAALHQSPWQCALAVTGGGAGAAAWLLSVPGGSRTVLEVQVPYAEQALIEYLGHRPQHFCSAATGKALATRAYERAGWLAPGMPVVGVGCTASLATDRPKRGDHRVHFAVRSAAALTTYALILTKGARDREGEEALLDLMLLNTLAEAFGVSERLPLALLPGEEVRVDFRPATDALERFLHGELSALAVEMDGRFNPQAPPPRLLLPGAFNPVHSGHWGMAEAAARLTGLTAAFELSVVNVDKPPLTPEEIRRRLQSFIWRAPVWLTRAPTFVEKAALFPGAAFIVGADTAIRIVAPRYYAGEEEQMRRALNQLRDAGCRFLVAGRVDASDRFVRLRDLDIPGAFRDLFAEIPEEDFRLDLSSTHLRAPAPSGVEDQAIDQ